MWNETPQGFGSSFSDGCYLRSHGFYSFSIATHGVGIVASGFDEVLELSLAN